MKKLITLSLLFLMGQGVSMAQIPGVGSVVSAPKLEALTATNKATLAKQLAEAGKATAELKKNGDLLQKSIDMLGKVNNAISTAVNLKAITEKQVYLIRTAANIISEARRRKNVDPQVLQNLISNVDQAIANNKANVNMVQKLLTEGLNLTDADRLRFLMEIDTKTDGMQRKLLNLKYGFRSSSNSLEAIKSLKKN